MRRTVFFGPFVGELGWEFLDWHGWVRRVCKGEYRSWRKIAASYPGRQPFYPEVDEFWPHPPWFTALPLSPRNYITDFWKNGLPRGNTVVPYRYFGLFSRYRNVSLSTDSPDVEPHVARLLEEYTRRLPEDTLFYCPHRPNRWEEGGLEFGAFIAENPKDDNDFVAKKIDKNYQEFDRLRASPEAVAAIKKMVGAGQKLIAIFPRERKMRRPDKNWAREKYDHLIALFQRTYPEHTVALLGEPGAACYANGVPEGCLDLINVESTRRMDLHVAALNKLSVIAVGSQSGALFLAQAAGCPSLTWGGDRMKTFHPIPEKVQEDRFGTPFIYHRESNPSEETIYALAQGMIERKIPPKNRARWSSFDYFGVRGVFMRFGYHSRIWWM